jgi:hypothetical protein
MRCAVGLVAGLAYALAAAPPLAEDTPPVPPVGAASKYPHRVGEGPSENSATVPDTVKQPPRPPDYIGDCWMEADGTIRMLLRVAMKYGDRSIVGHTYLAYPPDDKDYSKILAHVGPMRPGDRWPVPPWPD